MDLTKIASTIPSFMYASTYLFHISTCLVKDTVLMVLTIKIAFMLSTLPVMGSSNEIFMLISNKIMNMISFTASDNSTHPASELANIMILCMFGFQKIHTSKAYSMNQLKLLLLTWSP